MASRWGDVLATLSPCPHPTPSSGSPGWLAPCRAPAGNSITRAVRAAGLRGLAMCGCLCQSLDVHHALRWHFRWGCISQQDKDVCLGHWNTAFRDRQEHTCNKVKSHKAAVKRFQWEWPFLWAEVAEVPCLQSIHVVLCLGRVSKEQGDYHLTQRQMEIPKRVCAFTYYYSDVQSYSGAISELVPCHLLILRDKPQWWYLRWTQWLAAFLASMSSSLFLIRSWFDMQPASPSPTGAAWLLKKQINAWCSFGHCHSTGRGLMSVAQTDWGQGHMLRGWGTNSLSLRGEHSVAHRPKCHRWPPYDLRELPLAWRPHWEQQSRRTGDLGPWYHYHWASGSVPLPPGSLWCETRHSLNPWFRVRWNYSWYLKRS